MVENQCSDSIVFIFFSFDNTFNHTNQLRLTIKSQTFYAKANTWRAELGSYFRVMRAYLGEIALWLGYLILTYAIRFFVGDLGTELRSSLLVLFSSHFKLKIPTQILLSFWLQHFECNLDFRILQKSLLGFIANSLPPTKITAMSTRKQ